MPKKQRTQDRQANSRTSLNRSDDFESLEELNTPQSGGGTAVQTVSPLPTRTIGRQEEMKEGLKEIMDSTGEGAIDKIQRPNHQHYVFRVGILVAIVASFVLVIADAIRKTEEQLAVTNQALAQVIIPKVAVPEALDVSSLLVKLSMLTALPQAQPVVMTVTDAEILARGGGLFEGVAVGDTVLVFPQKIILYRPSTETVIREARPTIIEPSAPVGSSLEVPLGEVSGTPQHEAITIEVRNGSGVAGHAGKIRDELAGKDAAYAVVSVGNAEKNDYAKTLVIDRTNGKKPNSLKAIGEHFGVVPQTTIPAGEAESTADVLIILGRG